MYRLIETDNGIELHNEDGYLATVGSNREDIENLAVATDLYLNG